MGALISDRAAGPSSRPSATSSAEALCHPGRDEIELQAVLHALSDPVRLRIVAVLARGEERTCGSFELPVVKSTCTHHFRVLREAGVIRQRLEGTTRMNSLRRVDLDTRFPGLVDAVLAAADTPPAAADTPPAAADTPPAAADTPPAAPDTPRTS